MGNGPNLSSSKSPTVQIGKLSLSMNELLAQGQIVAEYLSMGGSGVRDLGK